MILGGLIIITAGFALTGASGDLGVLGIIYLIGAILYFFPTYYMFLFAKKTKSACVNNNQLDLDSGIENLKSLFKYVGIFTIVTIAIYLLMFILGSVAFGLA
jgi:ABC-type glycerol-3-phosphate transport system permease component